MKFGVSLLKLTLNISLLFGMKNLFITEISGENFDIIEDDFIILANIKPINYELKLKLQPRYLEKDCSVYFTGESNIEVSIRYIADHITLHAQEKYVKVLYAAMFKIKGAEYHARSIIYNNEKHVVELHFNENLHGDFVLMLRFSSCPDNEEVFKVFNMNGTRDTMLVAATHLQPTRTRALIPCWDDPRVKVNFNISITLDRKYNVLSNTPSLFITYEEDMKNMETLHFNRTSKMSMYDIGLVIFDRKFIFQHTGSTYTHRWYHRLNLTEYLQFAQTIADNVRQHLKTKWESFRKLRDADHIAIPNFPHDAMMKMGLNIFREQAIFYNVSMDLFATKIKVARLVAQTVAYERLDNVVTPFWWSVLWLNEGIAMLLGQDAVNKAFPDLRLLDLFVVQFHQESLHLDSDFLMGPIMPGITATYANTLLTFSHNIKAPVILYMIQRLLSDHVFWEVVKLYLTSKSEASFDDFCTAMHSVLSELRIPIYPRIYISIKRLNIREKIHSWSEQMHYPVVNVTQIGSLAKIQLENYLEINSRDLWLPITITTKSDLNFTLTNSSLSSDWLKKDGLIKVLDHFINAEQDDWIIVNLQQIGYYRVKYEAENWQRLAMYMNSDNYKNIHVLNRAQIMDDAFYFLSKNQISMSIFYNLTNYLSRETDYIAWYPVFKNFENMSTYFPYEESTSLKRLFIPSLNSLIKKIGHREDSNVSIVNSLRQEAVKWACIIGSSYCKNIAASYLELKLRESTYIPIPPWQNDWIYCKGLMAADYRMWMTIFHYIFVNQTDNKMDKNKMIKFLACSENDNTIWIYMFMMLNDILYTYNNITTIHHKTGYDRVYIKQDTKTNTDKYSKDKETRKIINIFHSVVERHTRNTVILELILRHFSIIIAKGISPIIMLTDIINHVYSSQHLDKITQILPTYNLSYVSLVILKIQTRRDQIWEQKRCLFKFTERFY